MGIFFESHIRTRNPLFKQGVPYSVVRAEYITSSLFYI